MIRTLLTIKRFNKYGQLAEPPRQQWSRSFTRHFIEGLYVQHSHLLTASALAVTDVMGSTTRLIDGDSNAAQYKKSNLRVASPSGYADMTLLSGETANSMNSLAQQEFFPGHLAGIQIGRDNTAVTPTDRGLIDRIAHGINASVAPAAVIEQINAGDTTNTTHTVNNGFIGFIYIPSRSFTLTNAQFKVWRTGNPGNVTLQVKGIYQGSTVDRAWLDTAIIQASDVVNANLWLNASPGQFENFAFSTPVTLHQGFIYILAITPSQASPGNNINVRTYAGLTNGRSSFGKWDTVAAVATVGDWNAVTPVYIFTGTAGAEMEYGGTDIYGYIVANPNASFVMRRIFMNNSGEAITVQESAIYIPLSNYKALSSNGSHHNQFVFCAARDIFAGIAVANGESLEVTYTPSITV